MENLRTYEEWIFSKKELTPDQEYQRQKREAERNRPRDPEQRIKFFGKNYYSEDFFADEEEEEEEEQEEEEY